MNKDRNPVGWFEIYVQDIERAKRFYQNTFQVTLERLESPDVELWAFPPQQERPGCPGAIVNMKDKASGPRRDNCLFFMRRLFSRGGPGSGEWGSNSKGQVFDRTVWFHRVRKRHRGQPDRAPFDAVTQSRSAALHAAEGGRGSSRATLCPVMLPHSVVFLTFSLCLWTSMAD